MFKQRLIWTVSIMLFCTISTIVSAEPITNCQVSRITIPLVENNGEIVCAASFMYGEYAKNPKSVNDMLNSSQLVSQFDGMSEESRWQSPEYAVVKYFRAWKSGNKNEALQCWESGYSRNKEDLRFKSLTTREQAFWEPFSEIVFLNKSYFGPYTRISCFAREVPSPKSTEKGRAVPGVRYLKQVGHQYLLTHEIKTTHIFDQIISGYTSKKILSKQNVPLNPNTADMKWIDLDVDIDSPPDNKEMLEEFSTSYKSKPDKSLSENYLRLYVKCEPVNIQFTAGEQIDNLSAEMKFFESAVTAYWNGTESEILSKFSGYSKTQARQSIEIIKNADEWPETRLSPFGKTPTVYAFMRTPVGTVLFFKGDSPDIRTVALLTDENGNYSLSFEEVPDVLSTQTFADAVKTLYAK